MKDIQNNRETRRKFVVFKIYFDISRKIDRNIYVLDNEKDIDSSKDSELDAKRFFHWIKAWTT